MTNSAPLSNPTVPAAGTPVAPSAAVTEPLSNRTEPPQPGITHPFGQRDLDAIRNGSGVWVWSPVLSQWVFWVRNEKCRLEAMAQGIDAQRIWSLREITGVQNLPPERLCAMAALKEWGTVVPGVMPARWRDAFASFEPAVAEEGDHE